MDGSLLVSASPMSKTIPYILTRLFWIFLVTRHEEDIEGSPPQTRIRRNLSNGLKRGKGKLKTANLYRQC